MTTGWISLIALFATGIATVALVHFDSKRRRVYNLPPLEISARWTAAAWIMAFVPGAWTLWLGNPAAFLIWFGGASILMWLLAAKRPAADVNVNAESSESIKESPPKL